MQTRGRQESSLGATLLIIATALTALSTVATPAARAASGDLDASFGSAGIVTLSPATSSNAYAVTVQSDGKIVVAGYGPPNLTVARLDSTGVPDPAFGSGGVVTISSGVPTIGYAVAIQPGGEIVVAGGILGPGIEHDYLLARLLPADGQLDASFGDGGVVVTDARSTDGLAALALQPDGKIVLGGSVKRHPTAPALSNRDFLVVRYGADGTPDPSFGDAGRVTVDMGGVNDVISGLLIQPDGGIVASGSSKRRLRFTIATRSRFAIARLDSSGSLDRTFARGGRFRGRLGSRSSRFEVATGLASLSDGSLVAVVQAPPPEHPIALAQLTPSGALDPGFGAGGVSALDPDPTKSYAVNALARQADGKLLLAGSVGGPTIDDLPVRIFVARTLADGSLDASFGSGGIVTTPVGDYAEAAAIALQPDGEIVIAGTTSPGLNTAFLVARYLP